MSCLTPPRRGSRRPSSTSPAVLSNSSSRKHSRNNSSANDVAMSVASLGESAPLESSVILLHAGLFEFDMSVVTVQKEDSLLLEGPHRLLSLNTKLLHPFLAHLGPQAPPTTQTSESKVFKISEFSVVVLHLLTALHEHMLRQHPGSTLVVTMLTETALQQEVIRRIHQTSDNGASSSNLRPAPNPPAVATAASGVALSLPLLFSADAEHSPIRLRWCDSWSDAIRCSPPARVIFLPSLFWLLEQCSWMKANEHVSAMVGDIGATLFPPTSWEAMLENKDKIYAHFNKFMRPARWVSLAAVGGSVEKLATSLLGFCALQGGGDGRYFIKGSLSCAKLCGASIEVVGGKCAALQGILQQWVQSKHQQCAGIQAFVPGFDSFELRTWLVPDHVTGRWRSAITIKTQLLDSGDVWAEQFQPLHGPGLRVAQLIDEMLKDGAIFFEHLRQLGLPALRIDCGYHSATQEAFFSEFAGTEAWMWSEVHGQDLAYVVGRGLGAGVCKALEAALTGHRP